MKKAFVSFRYRLFATFLLVSLIPLLLCTMSLVQVARLRLDADTTAQSRHQLSQMVSKFSQMTEDIARCAVVLNADATVHAGLAGEDVEDTQVYNSLFAATGGLRDSASFDLYDAKGSLCYSTQRFTGVQQLELGWGILKAAATAGEEAAYISCESTQGAALQCAYALQSGDVPVGFLVVSFTQADLSKMFGNLYSVQSDLMILSRFWRPVYTSGDSLTEELAAAIRTCILSGGSLDNLSDTYLYHVEQHEPTGITFLLQSPHVFTAQTLRLLRLISVACGFVCIAFSVLLSLQFSRRIFSPVQQLQEAFGQVEQNNLDIYVDSDRNDELGQLAQHFNATVCALKRNQEQLVENQRQLTEAQIRMLQAQLNPHFLCNTLDTMKWISKINQVPQVATMSTDLADILRFSISPEEFVPLRKEAEILERYVEIQRLRLANAFLFSMEVPPELEDCMIPKMMLQPLVENAILHGLYGVVDGEIYVAAVAQEGQLRISVQDNGHGLPPEMVGTYCRQSKDTTRHLGLYNVHTILQKNFGPEYGLKLENRDGGGAAITAVVPLKQEDGHAESFDCGR